MTARLLPARRYSRRISVSVCGEIVAGLFCPCGLQGQIKRSGGWTGRTRSALLMNFGEKERKRKISSGSAFAKAEQDCWMPLILQGKDFQKETPVISVT